MDNNTKIAFNSVIIFVRLCIVTIVSVIASRMVLDALGASDFGLYNVVGGIVALLNIVNASMTSTTYRFVAYELGKGKEGNPNKVFSSSTFIHFVFALCILMFGLVIGLWYVNSILNISVDKIDDARFVLVISILTTSITTIFVPFNGLLVACEKFALSATIDIFSQIFRLCAIYFFLYGSDNHIRAYSIIMLIYSLIQCGLVLFFCVREYLDIVRFRFCNTWIVYKDMLSFALWTLFGGIANIGKIQGSALLVNYFFGTVVNAAYAVGNQVAGFVQSFAGSLSSAAIPQITKNYSGGNLNRSMILTSYISKYTYILMLIVAFPVLLDMNFLLSVWLKEVPEGSVVFCKLIVLDGLIGCIGAGIPSLVNAIGNIRFYQIIIYSFTILGLPLSFLLYKIGYPSYYISLVFCIISFIACALKVLMLNKYYKVNIKPLFKISYSRMFVLSIPLIAYYLIYNPADLTTAGHFTWLIISEIVLILLIISIGLDKKERLMLKELLSKITTRLIIK